MIYDLATQLNNRLCMADMPPDVDPMEFFKAMDLVLKVALHQDMKPSSARRPVALLVEEQPFPKERPRLGKNGKVYTPKSTRRFEQSLAWRGLETMKGREPLHGPLQITLRLGRMGKREADIDNITKAVFDALNGIVWDDDRQIRQKTVTLEYGHPTGYVHLIAEEIT